VIYTHSHIDHFGGIRGVLPDAEGKDTVLNFVFTDIDETHVLEIENTVLHHARGAARADADATVTLTRDAWNRLISQATTLGELILDGGISVEGSSLSLIGFFAMLDEPDPAFEIVLP
jgi:alkyl sulfatase BDS1-like metallo-beta-lactamase superfamily hydrolase